MWGAVIAFLIGLASYYGGEQILGDAFLDGTTFLFWWYLVTGIIGVVIGIAVFLGLTGIGTVLGADSWGVKGGLLGALGGGGLGLFILALIVVGGGMRIAGAYILHDAPVLTDGVCVWDTGKLVVGGLLVFLPWLFSRGASSSSSSSSSSS